MRAALRTLTPIVEPVSLDEAYLDLSGTERLHGMKPAKTMAKAAAEIERRLGITVSVGLSYNKFLAKLASDLEKPRGFAVIGRAEAKQFLRDKPVWMIRGCGPVLQKRLATDGITCIGQLQDAGELQLAKRYGDTGRWLHSLAMGEDSASSNRMAKARAFPARPRSNSTSPSLTNWNASCGSSASMSPPASRRPGSAVARSC